MNEFPQSGQIFRYTGRTSVSFNYRARSDRARAVTATVFEGRPPIQMNRDK